MKKILFSAVLALAIPAFANAASCTGGVGSPLLVDAHQTISNDPDSGNFGGNWALDTFVRHIQIWAEGDHYCAQADDNGTFTTFGGSQGKSPQSGAALPEVIKGTIVGGTKGILTGTLGDVGNWGTTTAPAQDCAGNDCSMTSLWVNNYFPGGNYDYSAPDGWSWTYTPTDTEAANGVWVNSATSTGDILHSAIVTVYDENQLRTELADPTVTTIKFGNDITTTSQITVDRAVTVDGKGFHLKPTFAKTDNSNNAAIGITHDDVYIKNLIEDGTGGRNLHGINVYNSSAVIVENVTMSHNAHAGLVINGSVVAVKDSNTDNNGWGGINIDPGVGVTKPSVLTMNSGGALAEDNQIWSDGGNVTSAATVLVNADGYSQYSVGGASTPYFVWKNKAVTNAATITHGATTTLYTTLSGAIDAAQDGDTINIGTGEYDLTSQLNVTKAISIVGNGTVTLKATADFGTDSATKHMMNISTSTDSTPVSVSNVTFDCDSKCYGVQAYGDAHVNFSDTTIKNSKGAGLTVNGSTVAVNNIVTSTNSWGGINVDLGSGVTSTSTLTVNGTSIHSESNAIWIDDTRKPAFVVDTNNQYTATTSGNLVSYSLKNLNVKVASDTELTASGVTVDIPAGAIVSGSSSWDGTISPPTATTTTVTIPGYNTSVTMAISVGSVSSDLTFTKAVKLTFAGQAGKRAGWYNHAGTFTEITDTCSADSQSAGDSLAAAGTCKIDSGSDLHVWTKHFSVFTTYTQTAPVSSGGGSYYVSNTPASSVAITATAAASNTNGQVLGEQVSAQASSNAKGKVLGVQAYNFTRDLRLGSRGNDVAMLQQMLMDSGFMKTASTTQYFGIMTKASVMKWQRGHSVPGTGYFGRLSRAAAIK